MRKTFSALMIIIGSFLEIYFYVWRFHQDGLSIWLSVIIGAGLTLLLTMAIYHRQYKWAISIIIPLALYSVFATSAGQAFSLNEKVGIEEQQQVKSSYLTDQIDEKKRDIQEIDSEIKMINSVLENSVEDIESMGRWRTTLKDNRERVDALRGSRGDFTEQLAGLMDKATAHTDVLTRPKNIYTFYSDMLHFPEYWLQFILQTVLSAFIAIMAPIGLITYNKKSYKPISIGNLLTPEYIERWVSINWVSCRVGKPRRILSLDIYKKHLSNHGIGFDSRKYNAIRDCCYQNEVIYKNGNIIVTEENKAIDILKGAIDER